MPWAGAGGAATRPGSSSSNGGGGVVAVWALQSSPCPLPCHHWLGCAHCNVAITQAKLRRSHLAWWQGRARRVTPAQPHVHPLVVATSMGWEPGRQAREQQGWPAGVVTSTHRPSSVHNMQEGLASPRVLGNGGGPPPPPTPPPPGLFGAHGRKLHPQLHAQTLSSCLVRA